MSNQNNNRISSGEEGYKNPPDVTPRREGGEDAVAETSPLDSDADEKVLINDPQLANVSNVLGQASSEQQDIKK